MTDLYLWQPLFALKMQRLFFSPLRAVSKKEAFDVSNTSFLVL